MQAQFIHKFINARMFHKGNEMAYELDQTNRMLKLMRDNFNRIEDKIRREIDGSYKNKVAFKDQQLEFETKKFSQMRQELVASLDEQAAQDQIDITKGILARAKEF